MSRTTLPFSPLSAYPPPFSPPSATGLNGLGDQDFDGEPVPPDWLEGPPNVPTPTDIIALADTDPTVFAKDTLLGDRLLCVEGGMLLIGPSGIGKSSASMQQDILWSLGKPAFGIHPSKPLRTLSIQAENDNGDLAEMASGICGHFALTAAEKEQVRKNVIYIKEKSLTGRAFLIRLEQLVQLYRPDLIRIDPLHAYAGGDVRDSAITTAFLRNGLNPILEKYRCAVIVCHHTPKTNSRDQRLWKWNDFMYAGAGSAEVTNWARAIVVIDPTHTHGIYQFYAPKRGSRIGWMDDDGQRITKRLFCHHGGKAIFWQDATKEDEQKLALAKRGRGQQRRDTEEDLMALVPPDREIAKNALLSLAREKGIGKNTARDWLNQLVAAGKLRERKVSRKGSPPEVRVSRPPPSTR
jgi:RecA-family ATPase